MNKKQLYKNAYSAMMNEANLMNSSKAIITIMTEEHFSGFAPFFVRRTLAVSTQINKYKM